MKFGLKVNLAALEARLQRDIEANEAATRPSAQAGAQVFYDEVRRIVAGKKHVRNVLLGSIYQAFSEDGSSEDRAVYHISWNAAKAPLAHLVEFGYLQRYEVSYDPETRRFTTHKDRPLETPRHVAAKPFVRPAQAKAPEALDAMTKKYLELLAAAGVTS